VSGFQSSVRELTPQDAEALIAMIQKKQRDRVRDSFSFLPWECFTGQALADFERDNIPRLVAEELKTSARFSAVVTAIAQMNEADRQDLLEKASRTYKKSWDMLGINPIPGLTPREEILRDQTIAGSKAERMIAESIAELVEEQCRRLRG
jgi:hypothetical protein